MSARILVVDDIAPNVKLLEAKLRAEYRDPQKLEMLKLMILQDKVLDIIESKAKIEEVSAAEADAAEAEDAKEAAAESSDAADTDEGGADEK